MKACIVYYSQTGNTQSIARAVFSGLESAGWEVRLSFLSDTTAAMLESADLIGIGSPVWYEMPPNVRLFIEALPEQAGKPCFSFCTHGTLPDLYFPLVIPRLQKKGFSVLDWKSWYGDCCIQIFPFPYYTAGHPDASDISEAQDFGRSVGEKALRFLSGADRSLPEAPAPHMQPLHANAAIEHLGGFHNVHGRLLRDASKCRYPKCRICMDNCPMQYIDLAAGRFGSCGDACDDRHGCTYCELICPSGAIHPAVPYEEAAPVGVSHDMPLFSRTLSRAEADGTFRRLIPEDEVGVTTPYYAAHPQHPRRKPLRK